MTPTARSTTLPLKANFLKSSMKAKVSPRAVGLEWQSH
jgi:hypothetical protein